MIVLDASALVELLLHTAAGETIAARVADATVGLHAPHLADVEVAQALRRYVRGGLLNAAEAAEALIDLQQLDLQRHAHEPFLDRMWELRNNVTAYDAAYVALAEALDTIVLTCDGALSRAPGLSDRVELVTSSKPRRSR